MHYTTVCLAVTPQNDDAAVDDERRSHNHNAWNHHNIICQLSVSFAVIIIVIIIYMSLHLGVPHVCFRSSELSQFSALFVLTTFIIWQG